MRHLVAAAVMLCLSLAARGNTETTTYFVIDAPQLSPALIQFSRQSGLSIVFPEHLARNIDSQPLTGTLSNAEALDNLLEGTGLDWEMVESRIVAVYSVDCAEGPGCASPTQTLNLRTRARGDLCVRQPDDRLAHPPAGLRERCPG